VNSANSLIVRCLVLSVCIFGAWAWLRYAHQVEVLPQRESLAALPLTIERWVGRNEPALEKEILDVLGVDDYVMRSYFQPSRPALGLYVGFYYSQRQGDTIHSPLNCLPGAGWEPLEQGRAFVDVKPAPSSTENQRIEVNRLVIGKGTDKQLVYYWYQSRDRVVASEYWGKIYTVLDAVRHNRTDAALIRIIVPYSDATAASDLAAVSFIQDVFPLLGKYIPA